MKYIFLVFSLFVVSCNSRFVTQNVNRAKHDSISQHPLHARLWGYDHYSADLDSALSLVDHSTESVLAYYKKEISLKESRKKSGWFIDSLNKIIKNLSPKDTSLVRQYRIDKMNEVIDYMVDNTLVK